MSGLNINTDRIRKKIESVEGRKARMYMSDNIPHIGVGHNIVGRELADETLEFLGIEDEEDLLTATLSEQQIDYLFQKDLDIAMRDVANVIGLNIFNALSDTRKEVVVDMSFNLGINKFKRFKDMISNLQAGDFAKAADEILDSKAARDPKTKSRYEALADEMRGAATPKPMQDDFLQADVTHFSDAELIKELYRRLVIGEE